MKTTAKVQKRIDECRTTQATTLDLRGLALTAIPDEVFTLTQLTELNLGRRFNSGLSNNSITEIPPVIKSRVTKWRATRWLRRLVRAHRISSWAKILSSRSGVNPQNQ